MKGTSKTTDLLWKLFVNRTDRYLIAYPDSWNWSQVKLTKKTIAKHLKGDVVIGVAEMDRESNTKFVLLDIDGPEHDVEGIDRIVKRFREKIATSSPFLRNASRFIHTGNGVHLVIFFRQKAPARLLREHFLVNLLERCDFRVEGSKWFDADIQIGEIFPRQDILTKDGYAVRLPLGRHKNGKWSKVMFGQDLESVIPIPLGKELLDAFKAESETREKKQSKAIPDWKTPTDKIALPGCIISQMNRKSVHDGSHQNNLDLVHALLVCGYSVDECITIFSKKKGYHYATTQYQILYTLKQIRKGVLPPTTYRCDTYTNAAHGLECVGSDCPYAPISLEKTISAEGGESSLSPHTNYTPKTRSTGNFAKKSGSEPYIALGERGVPPPLGDILFEEMTLEEVSEVLGKTIVKDDVNKQVIFCGGILNFTEQDQMNIGLSAGSATGKTYLCLEVAKVFPQESIHDKAYASPKAFIHGYGRLVIDNEEMTPLISLDEYISKSVGKWESLNPKPEKNVKKWKEKRAHRRAVLKTEWNNVPKCWCVDLHQWIIIFMDQPDDALMVHLRPLLSHDKKRLRYEITDKSLGGRLKTKNVVILGYPSVWFLTTRFSPDEQERTRLLLLSPEISQPKLGESIDMLGRRLSDRHKFDQVVESTPARIHLKKRIEAIKKANIRQILIDEKQMLKIVERFKAKHTVGKDTVLAPRHQRDFPRLVGFIKAIALLNLFNRKRDGDDIWANQSDIDAGQALYDKIAVSNELGLPPIMYEVYMEIIKPFFDLGEGVHKEELRRQYYDRYKARIGGKRLDEMLDFLHDVGLTQKVTDPLDGRRWMLWPQDVEPPLPLSKEDAEAIGAKHTTKKTPRDPETGSLSEPDPDIAMRAKKIKLPKKELKFLRDHTAGSGFEPAVDDMDIVSSLVAKGCFNDEEKSGTYQITELGEVVAGGDAK